MRTNYPPYPDIRHPVAHPSANRLMNGGFEEGWRGWYAHNWYYASDEEIDYMVVEDSETCHSGNRCLKLDMSIEPYRGINPRIYSPYFEVSRGQSVTVSFWAKATRKREAHNLLRS